VRFWWGSNYVMNEPHPPLFGDGRSVSSSDFTEASNCLLTKKFYEAVCLLDKDYTCVNRLSTFEW
jgi:hypothetical protein